MKLLDLYCGAGGASAGYSYAGFEIVGIDKFRQKRYPFEFIQMDALEVTPSFLAGFDVIHASPPCQKYSDLQKRTGLEYPDLIEPTRQILQASGKPYIIENVDTAPLENPVMLCGRMFSELRVYRHRLFESNMEFEVPPHPTHDKLVFTHDKRKHHYKRFDNGMFIQVTGGGNGTIEQKRRAMNISWMIHKEINESIPPAYTKYLGEQIWKKMTS